MNRLQKRALIASAGLHGLLAVVLIVGPAFLVREDKTPDLGVLEVIPAKLVDEAFSGGGTPNPKPPPAAPPRQPEPTLPKPRPQPAPVVKPEPPAPKKPAPVKPEPEPQVPDKPEPPKRRLPEISTELITRKPEPRTQPSRPTAEDRRREREAERERKQEIEDFVSRIGNIASSSAEVEIPGPGGEAYANYAQVVKTIYTRAWLVPPDVNDDEATTTASVTIARDGTVLDARIIGQSRNGAVDASVRRTLDRVRTIGREFPAGAKEDKRTFRLKFNLKAKRLLG